MNENLPALVDEQPHWRRKNKRKRSRAAVVAVCAALLAATAAVFLIGRNTFLAAWFLKSDVSNGAEQTSAETTNVSANGSGDIYSYDMSAIPSGATAVIPVDITVNSEAVVAVAPVFEKGKVLVIATHSYEAYLEESSNYVGDEYAATGGDFTTARLGEYLASRLRLLGVDAVYLDVGTTSARASYSVAASNIEEYMAENDVLCIIDVHRAATLGEGGGLVRQITNADGDIAAQTVFVAARGGESFDLRAGNAAYLAAAMNEEAEHCAAVVFADGVLNQNISAVFFTAEIGSCGNSYTEAVRGASILARALANTVATR